jgi:large subunit ribosomal protein L21
MKFAIIKTGGKQYKVAPGQKIKIEKISGEAGSKTILDKVLLAADSAGETKIGAPYLEKAFVEAEILKTAKDKKKIVFRYHSKNRYRKKKGHRQLYTEVKITEIKGV